MRTAAPIVGPTTSGDLLWRPFAEGLPPEGAHVLVGNPDKGTLLKVLQRRGSDMFEAQSHSRNGATPGRWGSVAQASRLCEWWMLLPHVGPEAV